MILLNQVMPSCGRSELHRRRTTAATADLWQAIHELRADDLPLMRALMGVRTLGRRVDGANGTVLQGFERMGFRRVAEERERELVVVGIGQFWKPSGGMREVADKDQFLSFAEPGYVKVAFNFRIDDGELSTETRIAGTDPRARRLFGLYWTLIRPGSGLIRREWLRAIDRRARNSTAAAHDG
jgi:hypothetical protein